MVFSVVLDNSVVLLCFLMFLLDLFVVNVLLWYFDVKKLMEILIELQLDVEVEWESWWLLFVQGDGFLDVSFIFIGIVVLGLGNVWNFIVYGLEIVFMVGNVYVYVIVVGDLIYFG